MVSGVHLSILDAMSKTKFDSKNDYIDHMYATLHRPLEIAQEYLQDNAIESIHIYPDVLYYTERNNGIKLIFLPGDKRCYPLEIFNFGVYERKLRSTYLKLFQDCKSFLDIGANAGYYSILCRLHNPAAEIHAVEPLSTTYNLLLKQLDLNGIRDINTHQIAISNTSATTNIYYYPQGLGNTSLRILDQNLHSESEVVTTITLDDLSNQYITTPCDLIKCDVEGAERLVLQGGSNLLQQDLPVVHLELLRKWSKPYNYHPNDVVELLDSFGYAMYTVQYDDCPRRLKHITEDEEETNFFFVHTNSSLYTTFFRR